MIKKFEMIKSFLAVEKLRTDYEKIPDIFIELLISAEDHRFYMHSGVDLISIVRAFHKTIFHGSVQGGSTISMQLVRVVTGSYERSISRKIQEIKLAKMLNKVISKEEIPRIYLSIAYFGWKMNGIHAACSHKNIDLYSANIFEAAEIIARLKYPEPRISNLERLDKIKKRARHIVERHKILYSKRPNQLGRECVVDGRI